MVDSLDFLDPTCLAMGTPRTWSTSQAPVRMPGIKPASRRPRSNFTTWPISCRLDPSPFCFCVLPCPIVLREDGENVGDDTALDPDMVRLPWSMRWLHALDVRRGRSRLATSRHGTNDKSPVFSRLGRRGQGRLSDDWTNRKTGHSATVRHHRVTLRRTQSVPLFPAEFPSDRFWLPSREGEYLGLSWNFLGPERDRKTRGGSSPPAKNVRGAAGDGCMLQKSARRSAPGHGRRRARRAGRVDGLAVLEIRQQLLPCRDAGTRWR